MKKLSILFITLFHFFCFSQEKPTITEIKVATENSEDASSEIPFTVIEEAPIFPGCEDVERRERINCFQTKITDHIINHFRYPKEALNKKIQGRVIVLFIINKEGEIEKISTKGPHPLLENEAFRIISRLPKMKPGMQKGKPVKVKYAIPITFKLP